jgi:hypothetical protein
VSLCVQFAVRWWLIRVLSRRDTHAFRGEEGQSPARVSSLTLLVSSLSFWGQLVRSLNMFVLLRWMYTYN